MFKKVTDIKLMPLKDLSKLWTAALEEIGKETSPANFSTWFKDVSLLREEEGIIYLSVPNTFTQEWLEKKFHDLILSTLKGIDVGIQGIKYVIIKNGIEISLSDESNHHPQDRLDDLNEKFECLISRFVVMTNKVDSLIGKVGMLTSVVAKSTK